MKNIVFSILLILTFLPIYAQSDTNEDVEEEIKERIAEQSFVNTTIMPGIIAALVSGAIGAYIMLVREKIIEPKRWKKEANRQTVMKRIEAYGKLLAFLDAAEARRKKWKREIPQVKDTDTHLFLLPGHEIQFNEIFRENMGQFSSEIINLHIDLIESDEDMHFGEPKWKPNQSSWIQGVNLSKMHKLFHTQFFELRNEYEKMTGHNFL